MKHTKKATDHPKTFIFKKWERKVEHIKRNKSEEITVEIYVVCAKDVDIAKRELWCYVTKSTFPGYNDRKFAMFMADFKAPQEVDKVKMVGSFTAKSYKNDVINATTPSYMR